MASIIHNISKVIKPPLDFGPWAPGLTDEERRQRARNLRAFCVVYLGPAADLTMALTYVEADPAAPETREQAAAALNQVPARRLRHLLAQYGDFVRPPRRGRARP